MAPARSLPGDGGGTAEPPGAVWPARGSLPRAPPPTPPPAAAPAAASSSRAPPRLHGDARGRPRRGPGPPGRLPPAPLRRGDPGVSAGSWPAGRVVPAAPVRRAPCILGFVVPRPAAHLSACKVCRDGGARRWGPAASLAAAGAGGALHSSTPGRERFHCFKNSKVEPRLQQQRRKVSICLSLYFKSM